MDTQTDPGAGSTAQAEALEPHGAGSTAPRTRHPVMGRWSLADRMPQRWPVWRGSPPRPRCSHGRSGPAIVVFPATSSYGRYRRNVECPRSAAVSDLVVGCASCDHARQTLACFGFVTVVGSLWSALWSGATGYLFSTGPEEPPRPALAIRTGRPRLLRTGLGSLLAGRPGPCAERIIHVRLNTQQASHTCVFER